MSNIEDQGSSVNVGGGSAGDPRLDYMGGFVQILLRVSEEKWLKLLQVDENRSLLVTNFLEDPQCEHILVAESGGGGVLGVYETSDALPFVSGKQQKAVFFLKTPGVAATEENYREVVSCGDLSSNTVEQLQAFLDYAVLPTLCNPSCHEGWAKELANDLLSSVRAFRGVVARGVAQSKGHVIISVPPIQPFETSTYSNGRSSPIPQALLEESKEAWLKETVTILEMSVRHWSEQIQEVLDEDLPPSKLYPQPSDYYKYFCKRGKTLRFIRQQLRSESFELVGEILHSKNSVCDEQFQELIKKVEDGVTAAEDLQSHLLPLNRRCKDLEAKDLPRLRRRLVEGLLRMVGDAADNCAALRNNEHLVMRLYSSISHIIIKLSQQFLDGATMFRGELDDSEQRLDLVLDVMDYMRANRATDTFMERHDRLEMFVLRLRAIKVVFETSAAFLRLAKTEVGGIHGQETARQVKQIYDEFQEQLVTFDKCPYDVLEPDTKEFEKDMEKFRNKIEELDGRLGSVIKGCVFSCSSAEAMTKVLQVCEFLMRRPSIKSVALSACENSVLAAAQREMDHYLKRFLDYSSRTDQLPVYSILPPVSRTLQWVEDIKMHLERILKAVCNVSHLFISKKAVEAVEIKQKKLIVKFRKFSDDIFTTWADSIPVLLKEKLHQPIIVREGEMIAVNFDPKLETVIPEVKHLTRLRSADSIPQEALSFYEQREQLNQQRYILRSIVDRYNELRSKLIDIEEPLVQPTLKKIDDILRPAEASIIWSDSSVSGYLNQIEGSSKEIHSRVQTSKQNLRTIHDLCFGWGSNDPMLCRKSHPLDLSTLQSAGKLMEETIMPLVTEDGNKIHALMQENKKLFKITQPTETWTYYVSYVDDLVSEGLLCLVRRNLHYLLQSTSPEIGPDPVFMVRVHLHPVLGLGFNPSMDQVEEEETTVRSLIEGMVAGTLGVTAVVKRVDDLRPHKEYVSEMEEMEELQVIREELQYRLRAMARDAEEVLLDFQPYAYLWKEKPDSMLKANTNPEDILGNIPQIIEQIRSCETLRTQITENVKPFRLLKDWLKVEQATFKKYLLKCVDEWRLRFQVLIQQSVCRCLNDLDNFCTETETELMQSAPTMDQMDSKALLKVITRIQAVQDKRVLTDDLFRPVAFALKFLKTECNEEIDQSVLLLQQSLPGRWQQTKKLAEQWRQQISTPMAKEASSVRKQVSAFSSRQIQFRGQFRESAAFSRDCPIPAANMLKKLQQDIEGLQREVVLLSKAGKLFEVHVPEFSQLKQCENELVLLRELWDYIEKVKIQLRVWEESPWTQVDLDALEMQCKVYMRDIKLMDKEMRSWDNFVWLLETIKNILVALRAIHQLRNPAIKDRHWTRLSSATQVELHVTETTPLGELLSLELHRFEDVVESIVERASKELATERILGELEATWAEIAFERTTHARTGRGLLHISDVLISTLEDNQVQLQNLMSSKHVAHFLDRISAWVGRMGRVEAVIGAWVDVQRAWSQMESIFMGSEDIREQLPEDCERFTCIDASFKELVQVLSAEGETVVSVSDQPRVHEDLERLQQELALCEKALASYLETKRRVFPRFYFVSSADLLDILSNGTRPRTVVRHLPKLFDSVAQLVFEGEADDTAVAVISRDGEELKLRQKCVCNGAVESWLARLLDGVRRTLAEDLATALSSYEDGNRESWIFENIAQVALTGTQIWWTAEVSAALQRVRQGHETALKQYNKKQMQQLHHLIGLLLTDLSRESRQKVMTVCTMDVHARDVVAHLVHLRVESETDFAWQSRLRHRWEDEGCSVHICDARFRYCHEYLGNTPRLVVTPLTDRCFITLTQSLKLMMGGAPTGPAGTGKTETVKDLGRALGTLVYVFNCSEQMDYRSCANIYKGLAQTGAWGCFDEFNRISVEVLSVVAVQVKCVQDALRGNKASLCLLGDDVPLINTLGIFITMNPGYAGRTELPENLKTLFRPCAMVAPDIQLICEIMLVAEGFVEARSLGQKFTTLYSLCKQLLSKQDHYDWGLRAIKSVLVVAGSLKRSSPGSPEENILMLALRDFNLPKIVTEDYGVFMGLVGDLFPTLDVPRRKNPVLEKSIKEAIAELKLQPEDSFVLKVLQLSDLLDVRHSVFVIGAAGSGKSSVWRSLLEVHRQRGERPLALDLNPKAVTNDELFGTINPATREWKDVTSLEQATPATVSRGGVLYLDSSDVGWNPYVVSWIERRTVQSEKANLIIFFDKYVPPCLEAMNKRFKTVLSISDICYVQTLCCILECLLTEENAPPDSPNELYELYFVFCCVWSFGSGLDLANSMDARLEFSTWFLSEFRSVKFPISGAQAPNQQGSDALTVFDYYIEKRRFYPWARKMTMYQPPVDVPLQNTLVPTKETYRTSYMMDLLIGKGHPVMLLGPSGCGKTSVVRSTLDAMDQESTYLIVNVPFNFYTSSSTVQKAMELHLEKKVGKNFGPPGQKKIIYFIDDFNIPEVDSYGTCQAHTIIRQHLDYGHWYDRNKLTLKEVTNCQYVACMCPTAGSCTINTRLQRNFCILSMPPTTNDSMQTIFGLQLKEHLRRLHPSGTDTNQEAADAEVGEFKTSYQQMIVKLAIALQRRMVTSFHQTALKSHYVFNLRDISNVFKGLMLSNSESLTKSEDLLQLWLHESQRVYRDKLLDQEDIEKFDKILTDVLKRNTDMDDQGAIAMVANVPIHCHFAQGIGTSCYQPILDHDQLVRLLQDALDAYNDICMPMDLVLFEDAVRHICRITRILESGGNALLVGVGGSGRQSSASLAAYICNLHLHQPTLHSEYDIQDFKADIASLYLKAGVKNIGSLFMVSDAQVADERFLVLVNDLLSSGDIPDLFPEAEVENIVSALRSEVKSAGIFDSRDNCWTYFLQKVKRRLKVVLCFSPVGSTLRLRSRKFPTLISCTCIDWFHPWPKEALVTVCNRFLEDLPILLPELRDSVANFVAFAYHSVNEVSKQYLKKDRRSVETTPKSFLQHIKSYKYLMQKRHTFLRDNIGRLEAGLKKLVETSEQVDVLKGQLADQEIELQKRGRDIDQLLETVSRETEGVSRERTVAEAEEAKVSRIHTDLSRRQKDCEEDLARAEPALEAAQEALNTLNKGNLTELRSFGSPPVAVRNVTSAVMVLLATDGKIPRDLSWRAAKLTMSKIDSFLDSLINFDKNNIHENCLKAVQTYLKSPEFKPEVVVGKSQAAAGLCSWVINVLKYFEVFCDVEPKRRALAEANSEYNLAKEKLAKIQEKVTEVEQQLCQLQNQCAEATASKSRCEAEAQKTCFSIHLANRLLGGLASERERWSQLAKDFRALEGTLAGDVLVSSAFVAYLGPFTREYRIQLLYEHWRPFLEQKETFNHYQANMQEEKKLNIRPSREDKFNSTAVKSVLKTLITDELGDKSYDFMYAPEWTKSLSRKIHDKLKDMIQCQKYKFAVQVVIGEKHGQGMRAASGCLWDEDTDGCASVVVSKESMYCIASVYAVYCYCFE
ncbi:hypothetical protein JTE90_020966 [Oedothorax gibbosus]|uniref:Dynein beta chain, ciliary n=1 Tax=Oedothorax gibbosus TaxID=931172 RepID=A0AAV6U8P6_9ARAC|nr:hypothetical protein JTE90_020966 [Oedothorax gibbosus]